MLWWNRCEIFDVCPQWLMKDKTRHKISSLGVISRVFFKQVYIFLVSKGWGLSQKFVKLLQALEWFVNFTIFLDLIFGGFLKVGLIVHRTQQGRTTELT